MSLLTLFTTPKPFRNPHIALIQRNAIRCWTCLPEVDVILVGDEDGVAQVAVELGIRHLPEVARNELGTPLVSSIFQLAEEAAKTPWMCYANADMLFLSDLIAATRCVAAQVERFLIVGQRWDLDVKQPLDFSGEGAQGWEMRLLALVHMQGKRHFAGGSDYFVFPRGQINSIPDFAVGRAGWDNWMIYYARQQGWTLVDATPSVTAIHQNHDYSHLPGGKAHYDQPESRVNTDLAGGQEHLYTILDIDRQLVKGRICSPQWSLPRLLRKIEMHLTPRPGPGEKVMRWLRRRFRRLRRRITGSLV